MRSALRLITAAVVLVACVATAGINVSAANAYPSWDDVQNAKNNEAAKKTQMAELQGYISTIQAELDAATEKAQAAGEVYSAAVTKFDEADVRYNQLMTAATEAQTQDVSEIKMMAFGVIDRGIAIGRAAATARLEEIRALTSR